MPIPFGLETVNPDGNALSNYVAAVAKAGLVFTGLIKKGNTGEMMLPTIVRTELSPGYSSGSGSGSGTSSVTVSYTDSEGQQHTEVVPINEKPLSMEYQLQPQQPQQQQQQSVPYDLQLSEAGAIMQESIQKPELYNDPMSPYNNFYSQKDRIKIISDGLMRVFNQEVSASQGFIEIVNNILINSMGLKNIDAKYKKIMENIKKGMGSFRFDKMDEMTSNRDGRVANFIKSVQERGASIKYVLTLESMKQQIQDLLILVGDYISTHIKIGSKAGGRKSKNRYNYAHFIPLNPNSKKSFHNGISRKIKSRRRKQYRNKHTIRRK